MLGKMLRFGVAATIALALTFPTQAGAATTGWAGETIVGAGDTWEPYVAADPSAPYVYVIYNDFSGAKACKNCPSPFMVVRTSSNGGSTFGSEVRLCQCAHVGFQYDPTIAVSSSGTVYATWMNNYTIVFSESTDHGATWSTPLTVSGKLSSDKPWMGISKNGTDVYITFTKGTGGDLYETHSHNGGTSFSTAQLIGTVSGTHYFYSNGLAVLPSGTAVMSASLYPNTNRQTASSPIFITTFRTTNGGTTWTRVTLDSIFAGPTYITSSTTTLAADVSGNLVAEYGGSTVAGTNGIIWVQRSTDGGLTWTGKQQLTPTTGAGDSSFPAIVGGASGDFRLTYMDSRTGVWNVWYRASTDGGLTWSADAKVSDATSGASYKSAAGFTAPYGDYDGIAITNLGKSVAVMGESASFTTGPGNIWLNRQT
ncbi:MAG: glycoside hydrolase [Actinomycetota bacterium]|nr:glycoside hydrolase [Actinomycetota bacterium]